MGCGSSEEAETAPRGDRARVPSSSSSRAPTSAASPVRPVASASTTSTATPSTSSARAMVASPPQSASKDVGKHFQGAQLGTQEFQSKSYTERKHLEELAFKKAMKQQSEPPKPKEPTAKERELEIIALTRASMFDLSMLGEMADEDELEERFRVYEDALAEVKVAPLAAHPLSGATRSEERNTVTSASHRALSAALASMKVPRMGEALVESYPPLP